MIRRLVARRARRRRVMAAEAARYNAARAAAYAAGYTGDQLTQLAREMLAHQPGGRHAADRDHIRWIHALRSYRGVSKWLRKEHQ